MDGESATAANPRDLPTIQDVDGVRGVDVSLLFVIYGTTGDPDIPEVSIQFPGAEIFK